MMHVLPRFPGAILLTLLLSVLFTIMPISEELAVWQPKWAALAVINWALILGQRINLWVIAFIGLMMDTLHHSLMGQHALELVLVAYFSVRLGMRMTPEAYFQQFFLIFAVLGSYMILNLWIRGVTGYSLPGNSWQYWAPLLSSIVVWPLYQWFLSFFYIHKKNI